MMASWYRTGTITVTNGSTTVTGSGTQWIANAAVGEALYAPDGRLYEITNIASNTSFTIAPAYLGSTASGQSYVIVPSQSYIRDLASQAADLVNQYSTIANFAGQGKFGDGTATNPGIRFSDDLDTGLYRIGANILGISAGGGERVRVTTTGVAVTGTLSATGGVTLSGGTINNTPIGGTTPNTGAFTNLSYTGTLTGSTGILNIGSGQIYKDASGNVTLGGSLPLSKLHLQNGFFSNTETGNFVLSKFDSNGNAWSTRTAQASLVFNAEPANRPEISWIRGGRTYPEFSIRQHPGADLGGQILAGLGTSAPGLAIDVRRDLLAFFTGGLERARIDSAGNVGIGTSNPLSRVVVTGTAGNGKAVVAISSGADSALVAIGSSNSNGVPGSQTWDGSGQSYAAAITFGAVDGTQRLANRTHAAIYSTNIQSFGRGDLAFSTKGTANDDEPTERMRITAGGKILAAAGTNWVGTVSQNGLSSVIERGSNANGDFIKYADGTLICTGQIIAPAGTGTGVKNQTWTFPATFINEDRRVFCNFRFASAANMDRVRYLHPDADVSTTTTQRIGWHEGAWTGSAFGTNQPIMLLAIGRWY
jgi:adhesin HecA-like repeat protein